jgi:N-terminal acetyltransferase B complex catalytic subunit
MTAQDLFKFNPCNLDHLTETYNVGFYLEYLSKWPHLCQVIESHDGQIEGYSKCESSLSSFEISIYLLCACGLCPPHNVLTVWVPAVLAKLEASPWPALVSPYSPSTNSDPNYLPWHGHITALSVSPLARRLGHASRLTAALERTCDASNAWFVDLFVREENVAAQQLYQSLGYSVYRRVVKYYNDNSDAFDMRKPLSRDTKMETIRENGENIAVDPSDVW